MKRNMCFQKTAQSLLILQAHRLGEAQLKRKFKICFLLLRC